ncbi:NAD-dependent epimerase/dehydratase family protein [Flammeovirga agarivorans]|uniref:NAD-dependent epimerase/dehydratase family protein n=1 Tax=Flammeovirga agarivorans TaxID=2726742 RepID=A0A7X8XW92_9BACT|nr:NAD-dependent epimerase/dehydratase family protein [Flammeovirga agarivorans]NLR91984.1 NAD-dependent epimerase/dehydratase family protein [Flammeovirga agarivorans]
MTLIDKTKPVMISGATGYVAGWIVKKLLDEGLTVHAPVRNPNNPEKLKYLNDLAANAPGTIKYFKADLLEQGSYKEAMEGCELVFHTASPFIMNVKDAQKDLVDPALKGTMNVLNTVNETESVKRVVLTSSCVAIIGDAKDNLHLPNTTADESIWNTTSSVTHQPYNYSKTVAEQEAWEINRKQDRWDLVTINPSFVLGPGINPRSTSESFQIIKQMGDGSMKMGAPGLHIGMVDVRDLAEAHFNAGFLPNANGRNIISNVSLTVLEMANLLRDKFGNEYPLPKKELPKFMVWLLGPLQGLSRKMVSKNFGYKWLVDNSKSIKELEMNYRPAKETLNDFFQQMVDTNVFVKK